MPRGAVIAAMEYWGWAGTPDMAETRIVSVPQLVSAEMALDAVSCSWIVRIDMRSCTVVERIEYRCFTPTKTYDIWEEYE